MKTIIFTILITFLVGCGSASQNSTTPLQPTWHTLVPSQDTLEETLINQKDLTGFDSFYMSEDDWSYFEQPTPPSSEVFVKLYDSWFIAYSDVIITIIDVNLVSSLQELYNLLNTTKEIVVTEDVVEILNGG